MNPIKQGGHNGSNSIRDIAWRVESDKKLMSSSVFASLVMSSNANLASSRSASSGKSIELYKVAQETLELPNKVVKEFSHTHKCIPLFKQLLLTLLQHSSGQSELVKDQWVEFEKESDPSRLAKSRKCFTVDEKTGQISRLTLALAVEHAGPGYQEILLLSVISMVIDILIENHGSQRCIASTHGEIDCLINSLAKSLQVEDCEKFPCNYASTESFDHLTKIVHTVIHHAEHILHLINYWDLHSILKKPPLLRGDELLEINPKCKTDKTLVREMIDIRLRWQICHPEGTADDLKKFYNYIYESN
jgi:hypothetical protein